jgi:hypothetical protein
MPDKQTQQKVASLSTQNFGAAFNHHHRITGKVEAARQKRVASREQHCAATAVRTVGKSPRDGLGVERDAIAFGTERQHVERARCGAAENQRLSAANNMVVKTGIKTRVP